ncbi:metal-binding protein ZinT [Halomonas sp. 18H]|nr:metal-binding protein ZinT [Halomonas sp. 18H]MCW4153799.1 metal-binding protein ZinT [Halomonas sp. 18H]
MPQHDHEHNHDHAHDHDHDHDHDHSHDHDHDSDIYAGYFDGSHYHLYWVDDRAALLEEVKNWATYYPSSFSGEQIVEAMKAH